MISTGCALTDPEQRAFLARLLKRSVERDESILGKDEFAIWLKMIR